MITYLPYPDFMKSAEALDDRRLNKVRSDIVSILKACAEPPPEDGKEHTAIKMWRGNEVFLIRYGMVICSEYASRDNADNTLSKIMKYSSDFKGDAVSPEWWGDEAFHKSHQAHLLRLMPSHYGELFPDTSDELPLIWPRSPAKTHQTKEEKDRAKAVNKAKRLRERADNAIAEAREAAIAARLDPDTLDPLDDIEADEDLAAL